MSLTHDDVTRILKIIDSLEGRDVHVEMGDLKIHVTRHAPPGVSTPPDVVAKAPVSPPPASPAPPAQARTAATPAPAQEASARAAESSVVPAGHIAIRAPMMSTFYRAPSPGAAPFVEVGAPVGADDTVCLLEVMKLFTTIKAGVAGRVTDVRAANGAVVQKDEILLIIAPA